MNKNKNETFSISRFVYYPSKFGSKLKTTPNM